MFKFLANKFKRKPPTGDRGLYYAIPRHTFIWLLLAVSLVVLPHVTRLPLWLNAVFAACVIGRVMIYQGRLSQPSNWVKTGMVVGLLTAVVLQYQRSVFSIDAAVGVLLASITLKLVEMQQKRDVLLVIYLCYFAVLAEFIYSQTIPVAIYMAGVVVVISTALLALHQTGAQQRPGRTLKMAALMLLQATPIMLFLFFAFPRFGPLWAMPVQSSQGKTGLSDTLQPGAVGNLTRSSEIVFRAKFAGEAPAYNELYWRAITLDDFNGGSWRQGMAAYPQRLGPNPRELHDWYKGIDFSGRAVDYNIIAEANFQQWVYTLQVPQMSDERMFMRNDFQISSWRPMGQRTTYDVRSYLDSRLEAQVDGRNQERSRVLPPRGNEKTRQLAKDLRANAASDSEFIAAVLKHFSTEQFYYTLQPPLLDDSNGIDQFLFETRQGFCEHYANAFAFMMRAVGIPSRVVVGYMGGEFNPYDDTLVVRQYDAHAWAEVWLPDTGWTRMDPTAAVSPERVQQGSNSALQTEAGFMQDDVFTLMRFRNSQLLNTLRFRMEMLDYAWNRFVLNYDEEKQFQLLNKLFGTLTTLKVFLLALGVVLALGLIAVLLLYKHWNPITVDKVTRDYLHFCKYLAKLGFARQAGETPSVYGERIAAQNPQWQAEITAITNEYQQLAYIDPQPSEAALKGFKQRVRKFRLLN
jgi:protein-glutamine gamma-glutamyltransferase